jgi:hypothetical protein
MSAAIYRLHQTGRAVRDFADRIDGINAWRHACTQVEDDEAASLALVHDDTGSEELIGYYRPVPKSMGPLRGGLACA